MPIQRDDSRVAPGLDTSPPSARAYSLLLNKGVIRVSLPIPANAQFTVERPLWSAVTSDGTGQQYLSMYRRPLPPTNVGYLSAVMFDGRETVSPFNSPSTFQANLATDLAHQALDATLGHAQATGAPTPTQIQRIVAFEQATHTAQQIDDEAGTLTALGALGGPTYLSSVPYYPRH